MDEKERNMLKREGWIACDLDGTLAEYHSFVSMTHIGNPIPLMVKRVKNWLEKGIEVRIMTARAAPEEDGRHLEAIEAIEQWCEMYIGKKLKVTNQKDFKMIELWDDRAIQVKYNSGEVLEGFWDMSN